MIHEVIIPQLGMVSESLRVVGWSVEVGAAVERGQTIAEVETDKATTEIPSPEQGFLRRKLVEVDAELETGDAIAIVTTTLDEPLEAAAVDRGVAPAADDASTAGPPAAAPSSAAPVAGGQIRALPAARRLARELGVELADVTPRGANGAITVEDVEAHVAGAAPAPASPAEPAGPTAARRATARIVTESWKIPQFWVRRTVDLRAADHWLAGTTAAGVTLSDVLVGCCARVLRAHPELLPGDAGDGATVGISYLVATERALLAPTVPVAAGDGMAALAATRKQIVNRAREDRLGASDMRGGHFAVSNLGLSGIDGFSALVLPGHHGVLAVGRRRPEVRIEAGAAVEVPVVELVLSVDHREVDGVQAAAFLTELGEAVERFGGEDA